MDAVLIHGPRQCGKTTLAQVVGEERGYTYLSFDDDVTLATASADPVGFVGDLPGRVILDEVQRAPRDLHGPQDGGRAPLPGCTVQGEVPHARRRAGSAGN